MSLIRRKRNKPKIITIGGEDFYTSTAAAERLGFCKSKLTKGLKSKRYWFAYGRLEDSPKAEIYISVRDVEVFIRQRDKQFLKRIEMEAISFLTKVRD